jgi:hypothetical protein
MDTAAFFQKYRNDVAAEQSKFGGSVPFVVPTNGLNGHGSTACGEAATIIAWHFRIFARVKLYAGISLEFIMLTEYEVLAQN